MFFILNIYNKNKKILKYNNYYLVFLIFHFSFYWFYLNIFIIIEKYWWDWNMEIFGLNDKRIKGIAWYEDFA